MEPGSCLEAQTLRPHPPGIPPPPPAPQPLHFNKILGVILHMKVSTVLL